MNNLIKITDKKPRTAVELFEILPEGLLCQVIENTLYMSPTPDYYHQNLSGELYFAIMTIIKQTDLGNCITAPMDVFLNENNAFQPDILFIAKNNLGIIKDGKIRGTPDLIVEILSPGSIRHDTVTKRNVYEKCGVKEYFIVDPKNKEVITYYLKDKNFVKQVSKKGKLVSKLLKKTIVF